jgi:hypothetical protein
VTNDPNTNKILASPWAAVRREHHGRLRLVRTPEPDRIAASSDGMPKSSAATIGKNTGKVSSEIRPGERPLQQTDREDRDRATAAPRSARRPRIRPRVLGILS